MEKLYFRYGTVNSKLKSHLRKFRDNLIKEGMEPFVIDFISYSVTKDLYLDKKIDYRASQNNNLYDVIKEHLIIRNIDCILINNAHRMSHENVLELVDVVSKLSIPVMCYGLKDDYRKRLYEGSLALFEFADDLDEIEGLCKCGKKAIYNIRVVAGEVDLVGSKSGVVTYDSVCRECYNKLSEDKKKVLVKDSRQVSLF